MKDWPHQAKEFQIGRDKEARYLIWPMRSGKSRAVIRKADYLFSHGKIEAVVVIAPNGVQLNWHDKEIPAHCVSPHESVAWQTEKRADFPVMARWEKFVQTRGKLRWFCINMEALKHLDNRKALRELIATLGRNDKGRRKLMMAISEAHHFGRPGSKRTYFARSLGKVAAYRMLESGTPVLNSPLKAFSQIDIIEPGGLGFEQYNDFRGHFAEYEIEHRRSRRSYPKLKGYKNLPELTKKLSKFCSVVLRSELKDMPPLICTSRPVVMSEVQRRAYLEMVSHHLIEIQDRDIDAQEASERVQKLQQITHGWIKKEDAIYDIDLEAPFYDAVLEQVDGTLPGKSLVWCRYKETCRRVAKMLRQRSYKVVEYHGDIPMDQRRANRLAFLNDQAIGACVGTPNAGGEGLDFSAADAVIFAGSVPNALLVRQGEERATVNGGKPIAVVRITTQGTVDEHNWFIVDNNTTISESLVGTSLRDLLLRTDV